jgi:hypothetical protein
MGYTHYWTLNRSLTTDEWSAITADATAILALAQTRGIVLWYQDDEPDTEPVVSGEHIWFNGPTEDGHETFVLSPLHERDGFNFCKTARKPYDTAVIAILCAAKARAPDAIELSSDGELDDWQEGIRLAAEAVPDLAPHLARKTVLQDLAA